jgi:hypothetical protein
MPPRLPFLYTSRLLALCAEPKNNRCRLIRRCLTPWFKVSRWSLAYMTTLPSGWYDGAPVMIGSGSPRITSHGWIGVLPGPDGHRRPDASAHHPLARPCAPPSPNLGSHPPLCCLQPALSPCRWPPLQFGASAVSFHRRRRCRSLLAGGGGSPFPISADGGATYEAVVVAAKSSWGLPLRPPVSPVTEHSFGGIEKEKERNGSVAVFYAISWKV